MNPHRHPKPRVSTVSLSLFVRVCQAVSDRMVATGDGGRMGAGGRRRIGWEGLASSYGSSFLLCCFSSLVQSYATSRVLKFRGRVVDRSWRVFENCDQVAACEGCRAGNLVAHKRAAGINSPFRVSAVSIRKVMIDIDFIVSMISLKLSLRWIFRRRENWASGGWVLDLRSGTAATSLGQTDWLVVIK